jgi:DNA-binding transcriptional regulator YiaG
MNTKLEEFEVNIPTADASGVSERIKIQVPMIWDDEIQEWILAPEANKLIEETKARYMGLLLPQQIRELREFLGLTQKEISELLQLGEKTWTRWESGRERPSRSMNILLQSLCDGRIDANYLTLLRQPTLRFQPVAEYRAYRASFTMYQFSMPAAVEYSDEAVPA